MNNNLALDAVEMQMLDTNDGTIPGAIAGGVLVIIAVVYRGFAKLRRDNQKDGTDVETLKALDAAVVHWRGLYETAWAQVAKERELREKAEARATTTWLEVESLRSEVAALRREIEYLTATVQHAKGAPPLAPLGAG